MVNLFGKGFVGTHFSNRYDCIINDRNDLTPKTQNILYLISTTDNYNIKVNPYVDIDTNLTTLIRVLENCRDKDVVFNFASSWFVYGFSGQKVNEDSYCNPKGFYSITKRAAEQLLISYCETYGIKYRILRFANVLGPGDRFSSKKNALTYVITQLIKNHDITLYDHGDFYRDYIDIDDLCRAVDLVINQGEFNTIYNIGTGNSVRFGEGVYYVADTIKSRSNIINKVDGNTNSFFMDCSRLNKLGFNPTLTFRQTLDKLIDYYAR